MTEAKKHEKRMRGLLNDIKKKEKAADKKLVRHVSTIERMRGKRKEVA